MRTLTRRILAAGAVAGLLAVPAASAGAADTSTTVTLNSAGTLSITIPGTADAANPVNLGSSNIGNGTTLDTNGLGQVTVSDQRTGLVRTVNVTTSSGVSTSTGAVAFCQDDDGDVTAGVTCSEAAGESITLANAVYNFNTLSTTGDATVTPTAVPGALGTANLALAATAGTFETSWTPNFTVSLLGTEVAGTFYGAVGHSAS